MDIKFQCTNCGQNLSVDGGLAGAETPCPTCGGALVIPAPGKPVEEEVVELLAADEPALELAPLSAAPAPRLRSLRCEGCGGSVSFQEGQGGFACNYCGSQYEAGMDDAGHAVVRTIQVMVKRLDQIERNTGATRDIAQEERLQKRAQGVQDKIDFKYIEFDHSLGRKMGSAAVILWILGGVLLLCGSRVMLVGLVVIALGVGCFFWFRNAKVRYLAETAQLRQSELEPLHEQLRALGAVLDDGVAAVGYTESTAVPQRYCVCCHKNITPAKAMGGGGGSGFVQGVNLWLTLVTCGMWIPAWLIIEILSRAGGMTGRALRSGACPECGNHTLFPARLPA